MLIATAHGNTLENLIKNPVLSDLVGSISSVTLGDDEAKEEALKKQFSKERKQPTFDIVIEIIDRNTLAVYKNTAEAVDYILRGWPIRPEIRKVDQNCCDKAPTLVQEINNLDAKINLANQSFEIQLLKTRHVEEVKNFKKNLHLRSKQNCYR